MTHSKFLKGLFLSFTLLLSVILSSRITAQSIVKNDDKCSVNVPCTTFDTMASDLQKASLEHRQYQNLQMSHAIISNERDFLKDANKTLEKNLDDWKTKARKRNGRFWALVTANASILLVLLL